MIYWVHNSLIDLPMELCPKCGKNPCECPVQPVAPETPGEGESPEGDDTQAAA